MARRSSIADFGSKVKTLAFGDKRKGAKKSTGEEGNPWQGFGTSKCKSSRSNTKFNVNIAVICRNAKIWQLRHSSKISEPEKRRKYRNIPFAELSGRRTAEELKLM